MQVQGAGEEGVCGKWKAAVHNARNAPHSPSLLQLKVRVVKTIVQRPKPVRQMCKTLYFRSRACGHEWFELDRPCGAGMNLLTCPDFGSSQPFGPIEKPRRSDWARPYHCPRCDYKKYDMRYRRMMITKRNGWKIGMGPGRREGGVDFYPHNAVACCVVM
ncbi:hypothetical protein DOTSEDRAFT_158483 [Dothistroma septosporum NZE10]|uniref:Uncharacterized protein n=1 Tax=Dothistroma septosporum (strain NZE10 / CBS 128990) TaxID=675120 RepID=N1PE83_DOTSN|nr:hypothetical protein DOTSEDRAFT_158483 [Dothistroma septosporum NZE10]